MLPPAPGAPRPPGTHTAATLQPLRTRKEKSRRRKTPRSKRSPELTWELPAPIPASRPELLLLQGQKSRDSKARETPGDHSSPSCRGLSCSRGCSGADGRERLWASTGHVWGLQEWEKLPGNGTEPSRGWESPGGTALEGRDGRENNSRSSGGFGNSFTRKHLPVAPPRGQHSRKSSGWDGRNSQQINQEMSLSSSWDNAQGTEGENHLNLPEITMEQTRIIRSGDLFSVSGVGIGPDRYPLQYSDINFDILI